MASALIGPHDLEEQLFRELKGRGARDVELIIFPRSQPHATLALQGPVTVSQVLEQQL
eukprot:CAMPEP_0118856324 /NCGR_PEP_ID=MMETSP1163-20130328/3843_1 /TAXON_ID=124430 /ORGANISM="Phaeomonas parva, Strain CCMP2877" /LENGTH=57 /DNA_ID=CAMNT_0006789405 /DNA_START=708 /DNA_END=881 /DNA_ORIENTATION=+